MYQCHNMCNLSLADNCFFLVCLIETLCLKKSILEIRKFQIIIHTTQTVVCCRYFIAEVNTMNFSLDHNVEKLISVINFGFHPRFVSWKCYFLLLTSKKPNFLLCLMFLYESYHSVKLCVYICNCNLLIYVESFFLGCVSLPAIIQGTPVDDFHSYWRNE